MFNAKKTDKIGYDSHFPSYGEATTEEV